MFTRRIRDSKFSKIAVAGLLILVVSLVRQLLVFYWDLSLSTILFFPVILACTWVGGFYLAIFATALWLLSLLVFLHFSPLELVAASSLKLGLLVTEGLTLCYLFDFLRRKALREQEQRVHLMKVFINQAPAAIAMFDTNMRYIAASKRWYLVFKITQDSVVGDSHYDIFPEIPERWRQIHQRCLSGATEAAEDDLFIRPDGSRQWLRWEVRPWLFDELPPRIGGIIIFSEDITNLKLAHEKTVELTAQHEVDAALRTEALAANRSKDEFLATLSHELRSPLHALLGWIHVLKKTPQDPQRLTQALTAIESSVQTLSHLISDLLDANRIISGKLRLHIQRVPIDQLLRDAVAAVLPRATEKKVHLKAELEDEGLTIKGDPVRLQQCLGNLLSNAIKFTPTGGSIVISAVKRGEIVEIAVRDTGEGIRREAIPHVFERYAQSTTASTRAHGGLGLGLSIVKYLVGLHGGRISAASPGPGLGSIFTITLPIPRVDEVEMGLTRLSESIDEPELLKGLSVLVVDDNIEMRELLRALLEDYGADVKVAGGVDEALKIARADTFGMIVSDITMPGRSGYELIKELRGAKVSAPAIALTGCTSPAEVSQALEAGFNAHLAKPIGAQELLETIARMTGFQVQPQVGNQ